MFDLTTIQVMNYAAHVARPGGPYSSLDAPKSAQPHVTSKSGCAEAAALLEQDAFREQIDIVTLLDEMLPRPLTHAMWENSRWHQCCHCSKLYEINSSNGSDHFTCSPACKEVWIPF